jgi:hypothetical protein
LGGDRSGGEAAVTVIHAEADIAARRLRRGGAASVVLTLMLGVFAVHELRTAASRWTVLLWTLPAIYLGARVALDAVVFQRWAGQADLQAAMARFDTRLAQWKQRPAMAPTRSLHARIDGALRLRRMLFACVAAQASCALGALLLR